MTATNAHPAALLRPAMLAQPHAVSSAHVGGGWLYSVLFALALTGYPLAAAITTVLDFEGSAISYAFRGFIILLCLVVFAHAANRRVLSPFPLAMGLFLFVYLVRLLVDSFVRQLYEADYALLFFLGISLVPTIALASAAALYDERKATISMVVVAGGGVLSVLMLNSLGVTQETTQFEETRRLSFSALNAITVGYTGLFAIIGCVALWPRAHYWIRLLLIAVIVLGGVAMVQSASRGPIVAAFACAAMVALVRRKWYIFILFLAAAAYGALYASTGDFEIVERFSDLAGDRSANERLLIQTISIEQGLASPVLGHAYAETITYNYPHNLLIESGLALGLVGFAAMLYLQIKLLLLVGTMLRRGFYLLALLLLTALVSIQLSGALWNSVYLWIVGGTALVVQRRLRPLADDPNSFRSP